MKKLIIILLLLISFVSYSQVITYLKVEDKEEYQKYLNYCNTPVKRAFYMKGLVSLVKVNGLYVQPTGEAIAKYPLIIKWYPVGQYNTISEAYQKEITAKFEVDVPMRYPPSIDDFYKNWKTKNIQEGLVDNKTIGVYDFFREVQK